MSTYARVLARFGWVPVVRGTLRCRKGLAPDARGSVEIPTELRRHPGALAVWIVGCGLQDHRIRVGGGLILTGSYLLLLFWRVLCHFF
ncbi:MAG: hypothetical protein ACYCS1_04645 [Gammaproteobacteria bacterium]